MRKFKYYTNGVNEKRFLLDEPVPEGWCAGRLNPASTKSWIWINNRKEEKTIPSTDIIPEGWERGRLPLSAEAREKMKKTRSRESHTYNNRVTERRIYEGEEIPEGFMRGRLPMTEEQKNKISESHKGLKHSEETKKKISEHSNNNRPKAYQTIVKMYDSMENFIRLRVEKSQTTKILHKTFNTSSDEILYYKLLCYIYGAHDIRRNYKSIEYPFRCDFYIISENKFIELNDHWTHGGHPFDPNNAADIEKVNKWYEKGKSSEYYRNAIETWTRRDIEKIAWAQEHHLNYEVLYKIDKKEISKQIQ